MNTKKSFRSRFNVRTIATLGVLIALDLVLSRFASISTPITRITVNFIARAVCGFIFGPIEALLAAGVADALGAVIFYGGDFFIGFTITAMFLGAMYGLFLNKKITIPRILLVTLVNTVVGSGLLNTFFVAIKYQVMSGKLEFMSADFMSYFLNYMYTRLPQFGINAALQIVLLIALAKPLTMIKAKFYPELMPYNVASK